LTFFPVDPDCDATQKYAAPRGRNAIADSRIPTG
jgi:hypothetical protein